MKILVAIASYGTGNDRYLAQLLAAYRAMPFEVDVVVLSNASKDVGLGAQVVEIDLRGRDPWSLPFPHKQLFADRLDAYDLFIYSEDDTLITERNIRAFLEVSAALPDNELPGFFRYEESPDGSRSFPEVHSYFHWVPESVERRGDHILAFFTNEHAACYLLTREQLRRAILSGGYLVEPHRGKYDLLCSAATDPYTQCGFRKMICVSHFDDFVVHHLPNKYVGTHFGAPESEVRRQISVLVQSRSNGNQPKRLLETETRLPAARHSKEYYEPSRPEILAAIPSRTQRLLSIGCGSGNVEQVLVKNGVEVIGIPLDSVIAGAAEAKGVRTVGGDFCQAQEELKGGRFDCILISNLLHLVPDPVDILSSFSRLLSDKGVIVAAIPNVWGVATWLRILRRRERFNDLASYETGGVHLTSHRIVRRWFREAGLSQVRFIDMLSARSRTAGYLSLGLLDHVLSQEFIAIGARNRKAVEKNDRS